MKYTKNLFFYILAFFIVIGVLNGIFQKQTQSLENITYKTMLTKMDKSKEKSMTLYEKSDGTILLNIGDKNYVAQVNPSHNEVDQLIKKYNIQYHYVQEDNGFFSGLLKWIVPFFILILVFHFISQRNQNIGKANEIVKENTDLKEIPNTKLEEVGGLSEETKQEVLQNIEILKFKNEASELGIRPIKGMILYGPPGTGKTLLAKAIANSIKANFYSMSGSSFVEMFVGVGAKRVRKLFEEAKSDRSHVVL